MQCASSLGTQGLFQPVSGEGVCVRVEWQLRRIQFDLLNFRYWPDYGPMILPPLPDPNPPLADVRFPGGEFICQRPMEERRSAPSNLQEAAPRARAAGKGQRCCGARGLRCRRTPGAQETGQALSTYGAELDRRQALSDALRRGHTKYSRCDALRQIGWFRTRGPKRTKPLEVRLSLRSRNTRGGLREPPRSIRCEGCNSLSVTGGDSC